MKIICHFGAHKTASTHLQDNLKLNRDLLKQHGVIYFKFKEIPGLGENAIKLKKQVQYKESGVFKTAKNIFNKINELELKGFDTALLSYEGILGDMNHWSQDNIYPDAERIIEIYKKHIFKNHEIIPVYAIRNYHDYFYSTYKYELKRTHKFSYSLNNYLQNVKFEHNRWTQIVDRLDAVFEGGTKVYALEDYKTEWQNIIFQLIKLTGADIDFKQVKFWENKRNVSGKENELNYYYTRNHFKNNVINFKGKGRIYNLIKKNPSFFNTTLGSKFLLQHKKEKVPSLNNFDTYQEEQKKLKQKFSFLNV